MSNLMRVLADVTNVAEQHVKDGCDYELAAVARAKEALAFGARLTSCPPDDDNTDDITKLSTEQIDAALVASGFEDNQLLAVNFVKMTDRGSAQYEELFRDVNTGRFALGFVYVERKEDGTLRADFGTDIAELP